MDSFSRSKGKEPIGSTLWFFSELPSPPRIFYPGLIYINSINGLQYKSGQLNLIGNQSSATQQSAHLIGTDMPSQPQPQQLTPATASGTAPPPLLAAVNNLEMLGLKAHDPISTAFSQQQTGKSSL